MAEPSGNEQSLYAQCVVGNVALRKARNMNVPGLKKKDVTAKCREAIKGSFSGYYQEFGGHGDPKQAKSWWPTKRKWLLGSPQPINLNDWDKASNREIQQWMKKMATGVRKDHPKDNMFGNVFKEAVGAIDALASQAGLGEMFGYGLGEILLSPLTLWKAATKRRDAEQQKLEQAAKGKFEDTAVELKNATPPAEAPRKFPWSGLFKRGGATATATTHAPPTAGGAGS